MAASRVGVIGTFTAGASGTTTTATVGATVIPQVGDIIVFGVGSTDVAGSLTMSESPDRDVTWTVEENLADGTRDLRLAVAYGIVNENFAESDVITATHNSTASRRGVCVLIRGTATSSVIQSSVIAGGSGTTPASGSGILPADGIGIGFLIADQTSDPTSPSTGWNLGTNSGGANRRVWDFYKTSGTEVDPEALSCTTGSVDWHIAMLTFLPPAGGAFTQKTLSVASACVASITDVSTFKRTLSAASACVASLTDVYHFKRTLSVASACVATLTKQLSLHKTLSVASSCVATLTRIPSFKVALTASSSAVASLATLQQYKRTLSVAAANVATLTKKLSLHITLSVASACSASIAMITDIAGESQTKTITVINSMRRWWSR